MHFGGLDSEMKGFYPTGKIPHSEIVTGQAQHCSKPRKPSDKIFGILTVKGLDEMADNIPGLRSSTSGGFLFRA